MKGIEYYKHFPDGNDYPLVIMIIVMGAAITVITLLRVYLIAAEKQRLLKAVSSFKTFLITVSMFETEMKKEKLII